MGREIDYRRSDQALLYELRRRIKSGEKETYTKQELCDLLDAFAEEKAKTGR